MKKPLNPAQQNIRKTIEKYIEINGDYKPTKWDTVCYLVGYYGAVNTDHLTVIIELMKEGVIANETLS